MAKIETRIGDATSPRPKKNGVIVAHLVNNKGAWGGGFVHALNDLSPVPAAAYKAWAAANQKDIPLGQVQFVEILPGMFVANLCAQNGIKPPVLDLRQFEACLKLVFNRALRLGYNIHIPAGIGSWAAGGDRDEIHTSLKRVASGVEKSNKLVALTKQALGETIELDITLWDLPDKTSDSDSKPDDGSVITASDV